MTLVATHWPEAPEGRVEVWWTAVGGEETACSGRKWSPREVLSLQGPIDICLDEEAGTSATWMNFHQISPIHIPIGANFSPR